MRHATLGLFLTMILPIAANGQQAVLVDIGALPTYSRTLASSLSTDGSTIAGYASNASAPARALRWRRGGTVEDLGVIGGFENIRASLGVNEDGTVLCGFTGFGAPATPFRWRASTGMQSLSLLPLGGASGLAFALDRSGNVVVGQSGSANGLRAVAWVGGAAPRELNTPSGATSSIARSVSADGSVVAGGWNVGTSNRAFAWTSAGFEDIPLPSMATSIDAWGISADGRTVVGNVGLPSSGQWFLWNRVSAEAVVLPPAIGYRSCLLFGTDADAWMLCGVCYNPGAANHAFVWTPETGMIDAATYLLRWGVDLSGWELTEARGVSGNGRVLCGNGLHNGLSRVWYIELPPNCLADFDNGTGTGIRDGGVTIDDLLYFLGLYTDGNVQADIDNGTFTGTPDGGVTVDDLLFYLERYSLGC